MFNVDAFARKVLGFFMKYVQTELPVDYSYEFAYFVESRTVSQICEFDNLESWNQFLMPYSRMLKLMKERRREKEHKIRTHSNLDFHN